jgi:hypothetical protein
LEFGFVQRLEVSGPQPHWEFNGGTRGYDMGYE